MRVLKHALTEISIWILTIQF